MINIEMTDTFGDEANYSWVKRLELCPEKFNTNRKILKEVRNEFELGNTRLIKSIDTGEMLRYDLIGIHQCILITWDY
jgi:hypothetical protein